MDPETAKTMLLEYGWDAAERQKIVALLDFLQHDPECQRAVLEYDRIRTALRADAADGQETAAGWGEPEARARVNATPFRPVFWWKTAAVAASLLMALSVGWQYVSREPRVDQAERKPDHASLLFAPQEVQNNVSAFRQVAGVFGPRTSWLLVADRASDLGLASEPPASEEQLLLLRLVVEKDAEVVSKSDLVIVRGQSASVTVPLAGGPRLHYEITLSADPVTRLSLWAELLGDAGDRQTLAALATDLPIEAGRVLDGGEMATTKGNYAVRIALARATNGGDRP